MIVFCRFVVVFVCVCAQDRFEQWNKNKADHYCHSIADEKAEEEMVMTEAEKQGESGVRMFSSWERERDGILRIAPQTNSELRPEQ